MREIITEKIAMEYSEVQRTIAKCLLSSEKTLEEIRRETSYSALDINEALKALIKLKLVEKTQADRYKLIDYVILKMKEQKEATKFSARGTVFRANMVIEGAGEVAEAVEKQIAILEEKLRKEPYEFSRIERSTVEKIENTYCMFLDVDVAVPFFKDLVNLIITYGPSSVELLEPTKVELPLNEAQDLLNSIASTVHYYVTYILQLHMQKNKPQEKTEEKKEQ